MADCKKIVKLCDKVEVVATAKDKYHKPGAKYKVHPAQVEYLAAQGLIENKKKAE